MTELTLVCGHPLCDDPISITEPHIRQARLDAEGLARRGEFDCFHLRCHYEIGGKVAFVEAEPAGVHPGQEVIPLD